MTRAAGGVQRCALLRGRQRRRGEAWRESGGKGHDGGWSERETRPLLTKVGVQR